MPGFAHQGEDVTFVVISLELNAGTEIELHTNMSSVTLTPNSQEESCQQYRFTVYSQNLFSRSAAGISVETFIPTGTYVCNMALYSNVVI